MTIRLGAVVRERWGARARPLCLMTVCVLLGALAIPGMASAFSATSVSCASPAFCVAAGSGDVGASGPGQAETFNGTSWSQPTAIGGSSQLIAVSCPSADFCAAVDGFAVWTFNGGSWSEAGTAGTGYGGFGPTAVSCASASFCVAVGSAGKTETFDGQSWSAPSPVVDPYGFVALSCPSSSFCAAVDGMHRALGYTGSSWSTPVTIDQTPISALSCSSASFCTALDTNGNVSMYSGGTWSVPSPVENGTTAVQLISISCLSSSFCMAGDTVGDDWIFDGSSWHLDASHDSDANSNLTGVSCPSTTFCAAANDIGDTFTYRAGAWSSTFASTRTGALKVGAASATGRKASVHVGCQGLAEATCRLVIVVSVVATTKRGKVVAVMPTAGKTTRNEKRFTIGGLSASLIAGQSETKTMALNATGRRLLAKHHPMRAHLTVTRLAFGKKVIVSTKTVVFRETR